MVLSTGVLGNIIHFLIPKYKYMNCFHSLLSPCPHTPFAQVLYFPSVFSSVRKKKKKIRLDHLFSFPTVKFSAPSEKILDLDREGYSGTTFQTYSSHTGVQQVRCKHNSLAKQLKKYNHGRKNPELGHLYLSVYTASKQPVLCAQTIQLQIRRFFFCLFVFFLPHSPTGFLQPEFKPQFNHIMDQSIIKMLFTGNSFEN